ncbi:MAG: hypothetical protein R3B57_06060 [Phycisphaerales bacterium]
MEYLLALLLAFALPVRFRSRFRYSADGLCGRCRYDLEGLPDDAPCPECGSTLRGMRRREIQVDVDATHALGVLCLTLLAPFAVPITNGVWQLMYAIEYPHFHPPAGWYVRTGEGGLLVGAWLVWVLGLAGVVWCFGRRRGLAVSIMVVLSPILLMLSVYVQWRAGSVFWGAETFTILWRMALWEFGLVAILAVIRGRTLLVRRSSDLPRGSPLESSSPSRVR